MKFITLKSSQLRSSDYFALQTLFKRCFNREMSTEWFQKKYKSPLLDGESYLGLMVDDSGVIVGSMTIIPFKYVYFNKPYVFGNLIDLMIDPDHRNNISNFENIYNLLIKEVMGKIDFLYCVPNQNSYLYFIKILKWKIVGKLNYYIFPIKFNKIKFMLRHFNFVAVLLEKFIYWVSIPFLFRKYSFNITRKNDQNFQNYRFDKSYQVVASNECKSTYKIYDEDGIKTAYIVDFHPMSTKWLSKTVNQILKQERENIDLVLFISFRKLKIWNLIKVPLNHEPRKLNLIGTCLNKDLEIEIFNLQNWHFTLSDFDVR